MLAATTLPTSAIPVSPTIMVAATSVVASLPVRPARLMFASASVAGERPARGLTDFNLVLR